jgi:hypothetical protein
MCDRLAGAHLDAAPPQDAVGILAASRVVSNCPWAATSV